jgi:hypothetical protein
MSKLNLPSSAAAGVVCSGVEVALGVAFALENDLKKSDLSFFRLLLESDFFRLLVVDVGCGVDRPEVTGSELLSFPAGAAFWCVDGVDWGFGAIFGCAFGGAAADGLYFVVRLCRMLKLEFLA